MKGKELKAIPQDKCEKIKPKVKKIDECLQNKNFFHNDIKSDNIIFNEDNSKFSLIDFGESDLKEKIPLWESDSKKIFHMYLYS